VDDPVFVPVAQEDDLDPEMPVISVEINGDARAYPLSILMFHEIVNDTVGGTPIAVTYCPLCNSGEVFIRKLNGVETTFGTTGLLRNSDMVMYDRLSETWWQQFLGVGIVGKFSGHKLQKVLSRLESKALFAERHPDGQIQVPNRPGRMPYGMNPYQWYDSKKSPAIYDGSYKGPVRALARVVAVDGAAWSLEMIRQAGTYEADDLVFTWVAGQKSALHHNWISHAKDVGNVTVQRRRNGKLEDVIYSVPFAFAFAAFHPNGVIHHTEE
jgi:hypothetical protein